MMDNHVVVINVQYWAERKQNVEDITKSRVKEIEVENLAKTRRVPRTTKNNNFI
jgi:hypothetical protein